MKTGMYTLPILGILGLLAKHRPSGETPVSKKSPKNEVARATSKMAEYIEVLHGSVKEGGGVKCIKRGEIPYCTFTLTYCIVGPKTQKARQKDIPVHSPRPSKSPDLRCPTCRCYKMRLFQSTALFPRQSCQRTF